MKFGGTSVADEHAIARVTAIVRREIERQASDDQPPVVVVSALSKVTDGLLNVARLLEAGNRDQATARLSELADRHVAIASALVTGDALERVIHELRVEFATARDVICAVPPSREVTSQTMDAIASTGELVSSRLMASALAAAGVRCAWIDAREVMLT